MVYVMAMAIVDIDNGYDTESLMAYITDILEDNHIAVCDIDVEDAVIVPEKKVLAHVCGIEESLANCRLAYNRKLNDFSAIKAIARLLAGEDEEA